MAKKIYVADDEKNICFLIQNFLEKEGFEVTCFHDGESILEACEKEMPDLCILDVMMPGMDTDRVHTDPKEKSRPDHHCIGERFSAGSNHRHHIGQ